MCTYRCLVCVCGYRIQRWDIQKIQVLCPCLSGLHQLDVNNIRPHYSLFFRNIGLCFTRAHLVLQNVILDKRCTWNGIKTCNFDRIWHDVNCLDELVEDGSYIYNPAFGTSGFVLSYWYGNHGITGSLISEFDIYKSAVKDWRHTKRFHCVEATFFTKVSGKSTLWRILAWHNNMLLVFLDGYAP